MLCSAISCVLFAMAATVFYKKNIKRGHLPVVVCFAMVGLIFQGIGNGSLTAISLGVIGAPIALCCAWPVDSEWLQSAVKLDLFMAFCLAIAEVKFHLAIRMCGYIETFLELDGSDVFHNGTLCHAPDVNMPKMVRLHSQDDINGVLLYTAVDCHGRAGLWLPSWSVLRMVLIAIPQFVRKPLWLKAKLQELRSKLGPVYVLFAATHVYQLLQDRQSDWSFQLIVWVLVAISAMLAGILTRPDNSTMCDLLHLPSSYRCRKNCHKVFMVGSYIGCLMLIALFWTIDLMACVYKHITKHLSLWTGAIVNPKSAHFVLVSSRHNSTKYSLSITDIHIYSAYFYNLCHSQC